MLLKYRYHVVPDPKGAKVGNGGSTLVVLSMLENIYGNLLDNCTFCLLTFDDDRPYLADTRWRLQQKTCKS